jgi:signal transduction histidine kinase
VSEQSDQKSSLTLRTRGSLVRRMVLAALISSSVLLVAGAAGLTILFSRTVFSQLDDRLSAVTESLLADVQLAEDGELSLARTPTDPSYTRSLSGRYWQVGFAGGEAPLTSRSMAGERLDLGPLADTALAAPGSRVIGRVTGPDGETLRVHVQALTLADDPRWVVFAAGEDRAPADRDVARFAFVVAGFFALFVVLLAISIYWQVRFGLAPVLRMGRAVAAVRDGEEARVAGAYPAELIPLAGELNALLDHSREVVERARTHVGNLAHALKTPLTVLGNEARGAEGPLAELVERQTQAMSDQVAHHLRRARAAANARAIGARTPVGDVLDDLGRTLQKIYQAARARRSPGPVSRTWPSAGERQDLEDSGRQSHGQRLQMGGLRGPGHRRRRGRRGLAPLRRR